MAKHVKQRFQLVSTHTNASDALEALYECLSFATLESEIPNSELNSRGGYETFPGHFENKRTAALCDASNDS